MATKISISGLRVFAYHGVLEFERAYGQDFFIDCDIWVDAEAAAAADDLSKTVNYAELADQLVAATQKDPVDLIETLAARLLSVALNYGGVAVPVSKAKITVHKPNAPIEHEFKDVSVTVKGRR